MRVAGGLGTVGAGVVSDAQKSTASASQSTRRSGASRDCKPYHQALRRLFTRASPISRRSADRLSFHALDCRLQDERPRADVVLGDRYGTSCVAPVAETIEIDAARQAIR
jgi:N-formylglutamate deformylase